MSNPRIRGTILDEYGVRHEASGIRDGIFARSQAGWDSITTCGQYRDEEPQTADGYYITCLLYVGRKLPTGSILRMQVHDEYVIDEAEHYTREELNNIIDRVGRTVNADARQAFFASRAFPQELLQAVESLGLEHLEGGVIRKDPMELGVRDRLHLALGRMAYESLDLPVSFGTSDTPHLPASLLDCGHLGLEPAVGDGDEECGVLPDLAKRVVAE